MTKRLDVSVLQNKFFDAQRVNLDDLNTEQDHNSQIDAAIVNNHFGSGVLPTSPQQVILFDSDNLNADQAAILAAGNFDGIGLDAHIQPSDINLGNQLEVELTDSAVLGRLCVKVAVIGLSFDGSLQIDRFYFHKNEKQVTSKHYSRILTIFTNDFKGNFNCSRELGGRLIIREASPFQLSRDPIMVAQDIEPDVFWQDFKVYDISLTLSQTIQDGIGSEYNVSALDINTTAKLYHTLAPSDVTTQIGQKFLAQTNNIQKVTLLLGVAQGDPGFVDTEFDWSGDLVISIYALQTTVNSPTEIIPELAIDFDPNSVPLAQISYTQSTLEDYGYVLNNVPQPIDFVFSSTIIANSSSSSVIEPNKYYAITIKRSGAAGNGTILVATGNDRLEDARVTLFSGVWVDVPEEDLWFQIWTDAAKVATGQGYDQGIGIQFNKTNIDSSTGATVDNQSNHYSFADTGENTLNTAILQATPEESILIQDERTGNNVFSRKQFVPSFSFVTTAGLAQLQETTESFIIGSVQDTNPKTNPLLEKIQTFPGLARGDTFCIINPDADLLSLNLIGSKLVPDSACCGDGFKIFKVTLCVDGYGDVDGNGVIDINDVTRLSTLIGESITSPSTQQKIIDGYFDTLELLRADVDGDGYITSNDLDLLTSYVNKYTNSFPVGTSFTHMCLQVQQNVGRNDGYYDCTDGYLRLDGYTGLNIIDSDSLSLSEQIYDGYMITPVLELDSVFTTVPFVSVTYQIVSLPFWQPYLLAVSSKARQVPASFTSPESVPDEDCTTALTYQCVDKNAIIPAVDPGRNDFYVPDNLFIGKGQILRSDGSFFQVDFEINTITLELPAEPLSESAINVFEKFVADAGAGVTRAKYPAMRYSDCSTVRITDLAEGKVKFGIALQSLVKNLDGYSDDGYGIIISDPISGVYMDHTTGILKLSMKDLSVDEVFMTLVSKIQITVYLKKGGWHNTPLLIGPNEILGLISS